MQTRWEGSLLIDASLHSFEEKLQRTVPGIEIVRAPDMHAARERLHIHARIPFGRFNVTVRAQVYGGRVSNASVQIALCSSNDI